MRTCPRCQAAFHCGMTDKTVASDGSAAVCWCMRLPPLHIPEEYGADADPSACFCPDCLHALLQDAHEGEGSRAD